MTFTHILNVCDFQVSVKIQKIVQQIKFVFKNHAESHVIPIVLVLISKCA